MWHDTYLEAVLRPDYEYARAHLLPHLFDSLSAHAWMLEVQGVAGAGRALELLRELRQRPFPAYDPSIEDVFFTLDRQLSAARQAGGGRTPHGPVAQRPRHDHLPPERPRAADAGHFAADDAAPDPARPGRT